MTSRDPFQPQPYCNSVTNWQRNQRNAETMEDLSAKALEISVKNYLRGGLIRLLIRLLDFFMKKKMNIFRILDGTVRVSCQKLESSKSHG